MSSPLTPVSLDRAIDDVVAGRPAMERDLGAFLATVIAHFRVAGLAADRRAALRVRLLDRLSASASTDAAAEPAGGVGGGPIH